MSEGVYTPTSTVTPTLVSPDISMLKELSLIFVKSNSGPTPTHISDFMDGIIEKADRHLLQAYKVLTQEFAKLFCSECRLLNMEEDIGIPGIRSMKLNYKPLYILRKFTARQL